MTSVPYLMRAGGRSRRVREMFRARQEIDELQISTTVGKRFIYPHAHTELFLKLFYHTAQREITSNIIIARQEYFRRGKKIA